MWIKFDTFICSSQNTFSNVIFIKAETEVKTKPKWLDSLFESSGICSRICFKSQNMLWQLQIDQNFFLRLASFNCKSGSSVGFRKLKTMFIEKCIVVFLNIFHILTKWTIKQYVANIYTGFRKNFDFETDRDCWNTSTPIFTFKTLVNFT